MSGMQTNNRYYFPAGYGDTKITLLARDPYWLFAYWEVSENRRNSFIREFGSELWEKSIPVLKLTNISRNEIAYIRVNDESNNWYINVPDPGSLYSAEIGRLISEEFFINLAVSNFTATPSDRISPDTSAYFMDYRCLSGKKSVLEAGKIYSTYEFGVHLKWATNPSSPGVFGIDMHELISGVSSAGLRGMAMDENCPDVGSGFSVR